jgi:hypothetical protein
MDEIFNLLIKNNLSPNQLYILYCIKHKIKTNDFVNDALEVKRLQSSSWLGADLTLEGKSIILLQELDSFFKTSKKKTSTSVMGENFMENIETYLDIFPKFKLPSGKYARSDKKNLENNFKWFFESHSYSWETILDATRKYVDEYEVNGFKYMRTSQYFIRKQGSDKTYDSELANYCDMLLNGGEDPTQTHFKERVV